MRPELTKDIRIKDFKDFYWMKWELEDFCKENGINHHGPKIEIAKRIEVFLTTGEKIEYSKKPRIKRTSTTLPESDLSLNTIIDEHHRCSQKVRFFFKSIIPNFHFSTYIQNYFKNNVGKTYQDAVDAWFEEEERKKNPSYKTNISPQFEYNQFTRDFFADPKNKGKTRKDAITTWKIIKQQPGDNKYK